MMEPEEDAVPKPQFIKDLEEATGMTFVPNLPPKDGIIHCSGPKPLKETLRDRLKRNGWWW